MASNALSGADPVGNVDTAGNNIGKVKDPSVHVRKQQRGGRKWDTLITGIPAEMKHKAILSAMKKKLNCNGSIVEDENFGTVIQLQGDQVKEAAEWLEREAVCDKEDIKIHMN